MTGGRNLALADLDQQVRCPTHSGLQDSLQSEANVPEQIAILRLDTDFYESTKAELEVLYPRLSPGGVLILDDYGAWLGHRKTVDDYFGEEKPLLVPIDRACRLVIKT